MTDVRSARQQLRVLRSATTLEPTPPAACVKVWNGTAWIEEHPQVWTGSAYVTATAVKVWTGSAWVDAVCDAPALPCTAVLDEPFDNLARWIIGGTATIVAGRTATAANITGSSTNYATYTIPPANEAATVTVGFAWRTDTVTTAQRDVCSLWSDAGATRHVRLAYNGTTNQSFTVARGDGTNFATSATGLVPVSTWAYIELQTKLDDATGFAIVKVNGVEVINTGPVDTKNAGTKTTFDQLRLTTAQAGVTNLWDDLYLSSGAGCAFQGDHAIATPTIGLLLQDPCENFTAWTNTGGTIVAAKNANGFNLPAGSSNRVAYSIAAAAQTDTLTVGFYFKAGAFFTGWNLIRFLSDTAATTHLQVRIDASGLVQAFCGAVQLGATSPALSAGTWYYLEASVKLHDSAGFVTVRIDGVTVITATGVDTKNAGTKTVFDTLWINSVGSLPSPFQVDDIYIRNDGTFMGPHAS